MKLRMADLDIFNRGILMSDVNEEIVRLFFEQLGFLVRTNVKYYVSKEKGPGGESDIDLIIYNLKPDLSNSLESFVLTKEDLKGIEYAIVECKGWHTEKFRPSLIRDTPRIFNFVRPEALNKAKVLFNTANFLKILVISSLSPGEPYRQKAISLLRKKGIDHVIEFKTIMKTLVNNIELNKNYTSEILQTIRLMKKYVD